MTKKQYFFHQLLNNIHVILFRFNVNFLLSLIMIIIMTVCPSRNDHENVKSEINNPLKSNHDKARERAPLRFTKTKGRPPCFSCFMNATQHNSGGRRQLPQARSDGARADARATPGRASRQALRGHGGASRADTASPYDGARPLPAPRLPRRPSRGVHKVRVKKALYHSHTHTHAPLLRSPFTVCLCISIYLLCE